jgi:hypothetical protein
MCRRVSIQPRFCPPPNGQGPGLQRSSVWIRCRYCLLRLRAVRDPEQPVPRKDRRRKTFARITILWGIASIATMFVKTQVQFYVLRFLLGFFHVVRKLASSVRPLLEKSNRVWITSNRTSQRVPPSPIHRWDSRHTANNRGRRSTPLRGIRVGACSARLLSSRYNGSHHST